MCNLLGRGRVVMRPAVNQKSNIINNILVNRGRILNYKKIYDRLIDRGIHRSINGYKENHHIVPRCMGGSDEKENLVYLTPEEHYLAHQLLVKIYPNNPKLVRAASMMIVNRPSNKMYGWLRRRFSIAQSESQSGKGNSQYGLKWITDGTISKKIPCEEDVPDGWHLGRSIKIKKYKAPPRFTHMSMCKNCIALNNKETAYVWYRKFNDSNCASIREFVRISDYDKSHVAFIKMLKKYVTEFVPEKNKSYIPHSAQGGRTDC